MPPTDWSFGPLGEVAFVEMGQSPSSRFVTDDGAGIPFLQGNAEFSEHYPNPEATCTAPKKLAKRGDILISVRAPVGAINQADQQYCIGRGLAAIRFQAMDSQFGYHALSRYSVNLQHVAQGTTFQAINKQNLLSLGLPRCPLTEQRRIAEILDTVDETIRKTEEVLAKLEQIKKGLLHDLLTRGIDENGELRDPERHPEEFKDSELGRVPREWEVLSLESLSTQVTSGSRGWAKYYSKQGPLFLRIGNLTRRHINLDLAETTHVQPPSSSEGKRTELGVGDVLISITADLGVIGVVPNGIGEAYVNQHIALVKIDPEKVNSRWVGHYLSGAVAQRQIWRSDDPGAKAGLNLPTVRGLRVAVPPRPEQDALVHRLDALDLNVRREEAAREKLRLLKKGLMDDLLTGRVRVLVEAEEPV